MSETLSSTALQICILSGMALWTSLELFNNLAGYRGAVATVGGIMAMTALSEPPAVITPLVARKVESVAWHHIAHGALLAVLLVTTLLLWNSVMAWVAVAIGSLEPEAARISSNLALTAFIGMGFFLTLSGLWFGYWIRKEMLQATHLILICLGIAAAIFVNVL